jgi:hypothetical protein
MEVKEQERIKEEAISLFKKLSNKDQKEVVKELFLADLNKSRSHSLHESR